jgi:hypothetical protein
MSFMRRLFLLLLTFLASCGPVVQSSVPLNSLAIQTVALLPIQSKVPVQRELLTQLQSALEVALEGRGYVIINQNLTGSLCEGKSRTNKSCLYAADLSEQFGVDAFFQFELTSSRSSNFILAKYKEVGGRLNILNPDLKKVASIDSKVRVTGGVLLNSGQLVEGVKTSLYQDSGNPIVYKMVSQLASSLPVPRSQIGVLPDAFNRPNVSNIDVRPLGDGRYQLCLNTDGAYDDVFLQIDSQRAALTSVEAHRFCGKYYLGDLVTPESQVSLVVYSVYGLRTEVNLDQLAFAECSASMLQSAIDNRACQDVSSKDTHGSCPQRFKHCNIAEFALFKKDSGQDVYRQVSSIASNANSLNAALSDTLASEEVRLVAHSKNGSTSIPITVSRK